MEVSQNTDTSRSEQVVVGLKRALKTKATKIGFAIFFLFLFLVLLLPMSFDNSQLKFQIEQKVSSIFLANFAIKGKVEVAFFPSPTIIAKDVILRNYRPKIDEHFESNEVYDFYAKKIKIRSSFFSPSKINKIIIEEGILESYDSLHKPANRNEKFSDDVVAVLNGEITSQVKSSSGFSSKLFVVENSNFSFAKLPNLNIQNSEITIFDAATRKQKFESINFSASFGDSQNKIVGNFISDKNSNNFKFISQFNSSSKKPTSLLELSSAAFKLNIKGNFTSQDRGLALSDFRGELEAEIFDLKSFYKSYISAESVIFGKLKHTNDAIKISADIQNESGEITISNLLLNSSLVEGKGDISFNIAGKIPLIDVNLNLENLNFDNIWSNEVVTTDSAAADATDQNKFDFEDDKKAAANDGSDDSKDPNDKSGIIVQIKDIDLTAEIAIKNMKYMNGDIEDVSLYLSSSKQGEVLILPMMLKIPGNGVLWISGIFDDSSTMSKFVGKMDVYGENLSEIFKWFKLEAQNLKFDNLKQYRLRGDVLLSANSSALNNLYLNLNNSLSEVIGEAKISHLDKTSNLITKLTISNFDVDDYFMVSGQNTYLTPGMLIKKMLWLNDITTNSDVNLRFYKLTYKGEDFFDQFVKFKIGRGYFTIDDLHLKSDATDLRLGLNLDIGGNNPKLELFALADEFNYQTSADSSFVAAAVDSALKVIKKDKKKNFLDRFYSLPSLEGFDGKVSFDFKKLSLDGFAINNVKLNGRLKDGNINVSEASGDVYSGSFNYRGLIGIKINKIINGNLNLSNVLLQPLLNDLVGIKNVMGVANISSSVVGAASKKEDFSASLNSEIRFVVNAPAVAGYGLTDLMQKMLNQDQHQKDLSNPVKTLFNPNTVSVFQEAKGTMQFLNKSDGKMRVTVSSQGVNGVLSGSISLPNNTTDSLFNAIFLTGSMQKQIPINIATSIKGEMNDLAQSTNFDQVSQYLGIKSVKLNQASPAQ